MAARLLVGRQLHHMSPLSSLPCMRVHTERDSGSREETGPVRSSRESLRASAATHTQRERERGEWQHASSWDGSCITCLLSPLCHACACTLRETVGAARKRDGYGAAERACGPLQPHTRREREREVNGSTPPRGTAAASHVSSLLSAMHARAHGERQWEPRGNGTGTEQQREPAGLCSHTHAESEREREVNGSTPPHGMAAASHVPSLLSAMRVHTERDSGSRGETGPVRSSRESLRASAATHTQRVREREVNGSTPPHGMAAASHVPSLLSATRVHTERDSGS